MSDHFSLALGIGTQNNAGDWLEVYYPQPLLKPDRRIVAVFAEQLGYDGGNQAINFNASQCAALGKALIDAGFAELGALANQLEHSTRPPSPDTGYRNAGSGMSAPPHEGRPVAVGTKDRARPRTE